MLASKEMEKDSLKKVLILSVSVGAGHMRTAEALQKALAMLYPKAEAVILDTFRYASPFLEKVVLGTYMEILKMTPVIYGYLYRQSERGQPLSGRGKQEFNRLLNILAAPKLEEYIRSFQPEAIVCTHPFPLGIVCRLKEKNLFKGPIFAAITDFTVHSFWIFPGVDCYFVGSEALVPQYEDFGISSQRVGVTGIPIDPVFKASYDKEALKRELGLDHGLPVILIMGGGLGMGPLQAAVKALGSSQQGRCQLVVVAGTNDSLREKLIKIAPCLPCPVKVFGFVDNTHQLMAVSDLMVGKAGGLTCAEAMAMGLPLLIVDPLPGQEERNSDFIVSMGAGIRVREKDLATVAGSFLAEPRSLEGLAAAAASLGKPGAALDAVKIIADYVSGGGGHC